MDRARLFPAADRLPVVPNKLRSKEALLGRLYLAIDLLPAVLAKHGPPHRFPLVRLAYCVCPPAADLRQRLGPHRRPEYGANGGQILYLT